MSKLDIELDAVSCSEGDDRYSSDDALLRRLGKRPMLNRSFGFMSILGLSCSALCTWEGILLSSLPSLLTGGPAAVIWGFAVSWIGVASVYIVIAELSSAAPTAGGQYHWVALMAPRSCSNFLAYLSGWLTTLAWEATAITTSYLTATTLQGIAVLANPSYVPQPWQTLLIMWASALFASGINFTGRFLAQFEGLILVLHLVGFFGILVPLVYFGQHTDAKPVFEQFYDNGGWSSDALAFLVGLPSIASTLVGADCAVHMSEEIQSAATVIPKALVYTILINGTLAFAMVIAFLFSLTDLEAASAAAETMFYPFLYVFKSAVKSTAGAVIMASIIPILAIASSIGVYATTSRMIWSFARDKGLPFSKHLVKLTLGSAIPIFSILASMSISLLLALIVLGSSVALSALLSLIVSALYSSYLLVCCLTLWRRCTGFFKPFTTTDLDDLGQGLRWGPWRVPEPFGTINNVFAILYSIFLLFWSLWPLSTNPTAASFNWSVLVYGAVVAFSVVWYAVHARRFFKGPIKEV
ncbi:amino acid/polyamine transporter I [Xylaria flabelliformis]|nr:amino acid/polyamine transporter I [Xylaria flabelliformis]